jgi:uncharacterized repeat protein (TIGR03803 family)
MRRNKISGITFFIALFSAMLLIASASAAAQEKVLHSFTGADGSGITSGLVSDAAGNLYGVASSGGANGVGSVFELSPPTGGGSWTFNVLYSFKNDGMDGNNPEGTLVLDAAGNLYGTTVAGGTTSNSCNCGTVFELTPPASGSGAWSETILHSFMGAMYPTYDGVNPVSGVVFDAAGNLYGTTERGGTGAGTVFELIKALGWELHVLHVFGGGNNGVAPVASLVLDASGNLYGATPAGGVGQTGAGIVFQLVPDGHYTWTENPLGYFTEFGGIGTNPYGNLIFDADGNIYGTTQGTGVETLATASEVFELVKGTFTPQVLYQFKGNGDGRDIMSGVVFDAAGNLYGTSYQGGVNLNCPNGPNLPPIGCGTVFKLTQGTNSVWTEQQLHSFSGNGTDGFWPQASLIVGPSGNLYGTTYAGGNLAACTPDTTNGCGTVFEITP